MKKKLTAALLALTMVLALLPTAALAAREAPGVISSAPAASGPKISAGFRAVSADSEGALSYKMSNCMYVYFTDYSNLSKYKVTYTEPGSNSEVEVDNVPNEAGKNVYTYRWQVKAPKAGTYTIKVYAKGENGQKNGDALTTTELKLFKLIYDANGGSLKEYGENNGGKVVDGKFETYAASAEFILHAASLSVTPPEGKDFLYWSSEKDDPTGKSRVDNKLLYYTTDTLTVYAQYGTRPTYTFEVSKDDGQNLLEKGKADVDFGEVEYGNTLKLTLKYTGNTETNTSFIPGGEFDVTVKTGETPVETTNPLKLVPNTTYTIELKPRAGLAPGNHSGSIQMMPYNDRSLRAINYTVKIVPKEVTIQVAGGNTKSYGQSLSTTDIIWTTSPELSEEEKTALGVTFTSDGFQSGAAANEDGYDLTVTASNSNYIVKLAGEPKVIVEKAVPIVSVTASNIQPGQALSESALTLISAVNPNNPEMTLTGTLAWAEETTKTFSDGNHNVKYRFTPDEQYADNYASAEDTVVLSVHDGTNPELTEKDESQLNVTYDGTAKPVEFESRAGSSGRITVEYCLEGSESWSSDAPVNAGTYKVRATIEIDGEFAASTDNATLVIAKAKLDVTYSVKDKVYDGTANVAEDHLIVTPTGLTGADAGKVTVKASALYDSKDAGTHNVRITLTGLEGEAKDNYELTDDHTRTTTATITRRPITLEGNPTKHYGETFLLSPSEFTAEGMAEGETPSNALPNVELTSAGTAADAVVNEAGYPITATVSGGNYDITAVNATLKVQKATPQLKSGSVQVTQGYQAGTLGTVTVTGVYTNPYDVNMTVDGVWAWAEDAAKSFTDAEKSAGTATRRWTFTPNDTDNYEAVGLTGEIDITLLTSKPVQITAENQTEIYDGSTHAYTKDVKTDPETPVTLMYKPHVDAGDEAVGEWTDEPPKDAGTYDVLIAASASGLGTDGAYVDGSTTVHLIIQQAEPKTGGVGPFEVPEGTVLSSIEMPATLPGVGTDTVEGVFEWESPNAIVDTETASHNWIFTPSNPNYKAVTGTSTVTMAADNRTIDFIVYNLPTPAYTDYVVLTLPAADTANALRVGETVTFYTDRECTDPCGAVTITQELLEAGKATVNLDTDGLDTAAGTLYAKIGGKKTSVSSAEYEAELSVTLTDRTVTVGGTVDLKPEGSLTATYALDPAGILEAVENTEGSFKALAAGTVIVTVTATYPHPDTNHPDGTITVTTTVTVTVTGQSAPPSGGSGGTVAPSKPEPSLTPDTPVSDTGEAKAQIDPEAVTGGITDAKEAGGDTVTVAPQVEGEADKVTVELPQSSVDELADAGMGLTVKTGAADVTLSPDALEDLTAAGGSTVSVSVETLDDGNTDIEAAVDGKPVESVKGGLKAELPAAGNGQVLVVVGPDGSETVVKKSLVEDGCVDALLDGSCTVKLADRSLNFDDVEDGGWYAGAVDFASSHELFNGNAATSFAPEESMTRGMLATVLWRLENEQDVTIPDAFTDVEAGSWYEAGVIWATEHGIVNGFGGGICRPLDDVSREQMATMLFRYAGYLGIDTTPAGDLAAFSDGADVSDYAVVAMKWAVGVGLLQGKEGNALDPLGDATRAEAATIMQRLIALIVK